MTTIAKLNKLKTPILKINPALDAYMDIPMFEVKIAEANEVLRTVGLPKESVLRKITKTRKKSEKKIEKLPIIVHSVF